MQRVVFGQEGRRARAAGILANPRQAGIIRGSVVRRILPGGRIYVVRATNRRCCPNRFITRLGQQICTAECLWRSRGKEIDQPWNQSKTYVHYAILALGDQHGLIPQAA